MCSTWLAIVVGAIGVYAAFGQDKPDGTAEGVRISGRVVVAATKEPLSGGTVELRVWGATSPVLTAKTSPNGEFAFNSLPVQVYELQVSIPGFKRRTLPVRRGVPGGDIKLGTLIMEVAPIEDPAGPDLGSLALAEVPQELDVKRDIRAQAGNGAPLVGLCDVAREPLAYNGTLVAIRGAVRIAFEDFQISTALCDARQIDGIWLQYGSGPKAQPTTWCCGNLTPRDPPRLNEDAEFRRFDRYLTAQKHSKDCHLGDCYIYAVTATLAGRLDAVPTKLCPDGKSHCCPAGGFGHLGFACARLIIQSVSDVVPKLKPAPVTSP